MTFCIQCGHLNHAEGQFCDQCGNPLDRGEDEASQPAFFQPSAQACPLCGKSSTSENFCTSCGHKFGTLSAPLPERLPTYAAPVTGWGRYMPVSYTHLDVYKRQGADYLPGTLRLQLADPLATGDSGIAQGQRQRKHRRSRRCRPATPTFLFS